MTHRQLSIQELRQIGFAKLGQNVQIDRAAIFLAPERIEIGDHTRIDAFSIISGGAGVSIGRNVHIAAGAYLFGGGGIVVGDFAGLSARSILYSANDDYSGAYLTGPTVPSDYSNVAAASVTIGRHVVVGAGAIVLPGVNIADGAAVGAMSLVRNSVEPFKIVAGVPARVIKDRERGLLALEDQYLVDQSLGKKRRPRLQIHIPISPTPSFFTMVLFFAASVRAFGGAFRDARIVVSVGEDCEPFDVASARPELAEYGIEWRWVDREAFRRHSYFATGLDRWAEEFDCDYVLMADADILILHDFDDILGLLPDEKSVAGCIATFPPFMSRDSGDDRVRWPELFEIAGLGEPRFDHAIPGYGLLYSTEHMAFAPPYYNFGFVFGTRDAMNAIRGTFEADYYLAAGYMKTDLAGQGALCLSIVRQSLTAVALPVRYNFWSHPSYLEGFPIERADLRVLHYLGGPFKKHVDNESTTDVANWVAAHSDSTDELERLMVEALGGVLNCVAAP